jgi:hypothetical protein
MPTGNINQILMTTELNRQKDNIFMLIQLRHCKKTIFLWQYNFDNLRPCRAHAATHKAWEEEADFCI